MPPSRRTTTAAARSSAEARCQRATHLDGARAAHRRRARPSRASRRPRRRTARPRAPCSAGRAHVERAQHAEALGERRAARGRGRAVAVARYIDREARDAVDARDKRRAQEQYGRAVHRGGARGELTGGPLAAAVAAARGRRRRAGGRECELGLGLDDRELAGERAACARRVGRGDVGAEHHRRSHRRRGTVGTRTSPCTSPARCVTNEPASRARRRACRTPSGRRFVAAPSASAGTARSPPKS